MSNKFIHSDSRNSKLNVYHTDRNCQTLKGVVRPATESEIEHHNLELCEWCDPDKENPNVQRDQDFSYQNALKEAAKDE